MGAGPAGLVLPNAGAAGADPNAGVLPKLGAGGVPNVVVIV